MVTVPTTISRAALIAFVEAALTASGIPLPDADTLRRVARYTDAVANGVWEFDGVGCPLTQAGCAGAAQFASETDPYTRFYDSFDEQVREWWMARQDGDRVPPRILVVN